MWVITGPFDTEGAAELSSQKSKLLKAGKSYTLGRKSQPLLILNKKVSQAHCSFSVEACSLDDVHDPEKQLTLTFHNERDKTMRMVRGDSSQMVVGGKMSLELQDGDVIYIVTGIPVSVKWLPVCCYSPSLKGKSNLSLETCSQLGVSIVYIPNSHVTHHILPTYVANASVATSLISAAQFVKFEWLMEIIKNADSLEENFALPSTSKYRPTFSPTLNPSQKVFRVWEPNEERFNIFFPYRFLVFGEKVREIEGDLRELIKRGGGFIETFDVAGGVAKLHKALSRGQAKEGQQLVVVVDVKDVTAAIGRDEWKRLAAEVNSFELPVTSPETVVQSVIDVDPSFLTTYQPSPAATNVLDSNISTSSLPTCVLNSIPDEPSIPPEQAPAKKRLVRRAASRQPSVEPSPQPVPNETPKPRRLLARRGKTADPNDTSEPADEASDALMAAPVVPTPGRPRLKRRLGGTSGSGSGAPESSAQSQLPDILPSVPEDEPPLKKFKALFDASGPARSGTGSLDDDVAGSEAGTGGFSTQSQSQTGGFVRRPATASNLSALREEEEESPVSGVGQTQRGTKRPLDAVQDEDPDVEMGHVGGDDGQHARKRQALDDRNAAPAEPTTRSPKSKRTERERKPGAPVGEPDTDAEFLKAVASTKKGKRAEDNFDREFNYLRISKPKVVDSDRDQREEEEEEWRKFTDFGDDEGLRGNFMVVLEMDVYQKRGKENAGEGLQGTDGQTERVIADKWKNQPNFKKFKQKILPTRRALIELVASEDNDFDPPPVHWKNKKGIHSDPSGSFEIKTEGQRPQFRAPTKKPIAISDDDSDQPPTLGKAKAASTQSMHPKPPSRAGSRAPSTRTTSKPSSRAGSAVPSMHMTSKISKPALFLDSDDDIAEVGEEHQSQSMSKAGYEDGDDEEQTLRSSGAATTMERSTRAVVAGRGRRKVAAMHDDSDDDGAVFRGFGKRRR